MNELFQKYGLITHGISRTYIVPLDKRVYGYERATITELTVEDLVLNEVTWKEAILKMASYLQEKYRKQHEELYSFKIEWAKGTIFSKDKFQVLSDEIEEGLWVNTGYASVHGIMLIQDLLKLFNVDLNKCRLIVHLPSMSESVEVIKYFKTNLLSNFKTFLLDENLSEDACGSVMRGIETLNKVLVKMNAGANDFYLMDNRATLSLYKGKVIKYLADNHIYNEKQLKLAQRFLDYYTEFFREYEIELLKKEKTNANK